MATRREQKEQARAARLAREQAAAQQAARKRRIQIFGGLIAAAVVVVAIVVVLSVTGGGSKQTSTAAADDNGVLTTSSGNDEYEVGLQDGANAKLVGKKISEVIDGIPQSGTTLGDSAAKVTLLYFGDLQCSQCQQFEEFYLPQFISSYVRTGKAKLTYHSFCTATCNNTAIGSTTKAEQVFSTQQIAAYAAGMQNKFWDYAERFYYQQGQEDTAYVDESYLSALAKQISGLNVSTWQQDRKDPSLSDKVSADATLAEKYFKELNVPQDEWGTPGLFFIGPKGTKMASNYQTSALVAAYNAVA